MNEKTEREKMLAGEMYLPSDPELVAMRLRARSLTRLYNATREDEGSRRDELLGQLFGRLGPRAEIEPPFHCDYGAHIRAGARLYMNFGCVVLDCAEVVLGDEVFIGPYVQIYTASHPLNASERSNGAESAYPVRVGNRVWIGGGAILCPGVTIGDDTTIGAGSVVTRDLPSGVVAVGNPCRVLRRLE